jgi:hypothetical protein
VNQTRPHCANQMGKTHSKLLAARNSRNMALGWHVICESVLSLQPATLRAGNHCSNIWSSAPEDGHNVARNILS